MQNLEIKPIAVKIENAFYGRIKTLAKTKKRSAHALMKEAIYEYMEREEQHEKLRQEMVAVWDDFEKTGLHATEDEIEKWLLSWGAASEMTVPQCHR